MKTKVILIFITALFFTALQGCGSGYVNNNGNTGSEIQSNNNPDNNNQDVYDQQQYNVDDLNQYGDWTNYDSYGRVWRPSVTAGWQPFTNGHWAYDGYDWVWVSYEPFGWMVYHYGSWENTPDYGWVWVPEQDAWSPACVQWEYYDDQVCWAPRRAQNRSWNEPWDQGNVHPWVAVRMEDFNRENVTQYRINNISRVENTQSVQIQRRQPDIKVVQQRVKEPIQTVRIEREPVQKNPVVTPPADRNPVRNDVTPPVDRNPNVTPPVDRNPVRNNTQPPVRNQNDTRTTTQNSKPIYHMQIPPQERQKVDKYRPAVEKNVLVKKPPVNNNNNRTQPNNTKRNDNEKK